MGMCAAAEMAVRMGIFEQRDAARIKEVVRLYRLPADIPDSLNAGEMIAAMEIDKKARAGKIRFVLPESIGSVRIEDGIDRGLIEEVIAACRA